MVTETSKGSSVSNPHRAMAARALVVVEQLKKFKDYQGSNPFFDKDGNLGARIHHHDGGTYFIDENRRMAVSLSGSALEVNAVGFSSIEPTLGIPLDKNLNEVGDLFLVTAREIAQLRTVKNNPASLREGDVPKFLGTVGEIADLAVASDTVSQVGLDLQVKVLAGQSGIKRPTVPATDDISAAAVQTAQAAIETLQKLSGRDNLQKLSCSNDRRGINAEDRAALLDPLENDNASITSDFIAKQIHRDLARAPEDNTGVKAPILNAGRASSAAADRALRAVKDRA